MEPRLAPRQLRKLTVLPWAERVPPGCRQVHLPSTGSGLRRIAPLVIRFADLAQQQRFDAVYSFLTWTNTMVAAAKVLGGRYVHIASEHAMADSLRSNGNPLASLAKTLPVVYRRPDWIVVVSDAARSSLLAAGMLPRPERAVIIPNPVDITQIRVLSKAQIETAFRPDGGRLIVCVARLHAQKDHMTLLRAMSLLPTSFVLAVVGDGPLREELETAARRLGLRDRVTFVGSLANPYPLIRQADVVVLPSREEGFGLVAVEAAALGVPFVGSGVGGLREVCDILGHRTFPAGDHTALAAAVVDALSTSFPRLPPAEVALSRFDPSKIAKMYLGLGVRSPPPPSRAQTNGQGKW
jgi:glycosyltransferase involved in cell wall biosynthesis